MHVCFLLHVVSDARAQLHGGGESEASGRRRRHVRMQDRFQGVQGVVLGYLVERRGQHGGRKLPSFLLFLFLSFHLGVHAHVDQWGSRTLNQISMKKWENVVFKLTKRIPKHTVQTLNDTNEWETVVWVKERCVHLWVWERVPTYILSLILLKV